MKKNQSYALAPNQVMLGKNGILIAKYYYMNSFIKYTKQSIKSAVKCYTLALLVIIFSTSSYGQQQSNAPVNEIEQYIQILQNLPKDKKEIAQQLTRDWSEMGLEVMSKFLQSDSNSNISELLEKLSNGSNPQSIEDTMQFMELREASHEKILAHLIKKFRSQPEKLEQMLQSTEILQSYLNKNQVKHNIGFRSFNGLILTLDLIAILYSQYGSKFSPQVYEGFHSNPKVGSYLIMAFVGSSIIGEIMNSNWQVREIIENWKERRKSKKMISQVSKMIKWLQSDPVEKEFSSMYITNNLSEKAAFEAFPKIVEAFTSEVEFLREQSTFGNQEAIHKIKIFNDFIIELNSRLTNTEKQVLLDHLEKGSSTEIHASVLSSIKRKISIQSTELQKDFNEKNLSFDFKGKKNALLQEIRLVKNKMSDIKDIHLRGIKVMTTGLTIASISIGLKIAVENSTILIDQNIFLGEWIRSFNNHLSTLAYSATLSSAGYLTYNTYQRYTSGKIFETHVKKLESLSENYDKYKRKWMKEAKSCKSAL